METQDTTSEAHAVETPAATHVVDKGELYGVLAEFDTPGALVKAAKKVRDAGYTEFDCYSPFPVHGIDEAMGIKRTILPLLIFGGGITGLIGGALLQWYCNAYAWHWNIAGKPLWLLPITPNQVPVAFECTILLSVFTSFFGMWILNKLPQVWHPFFRLDRFAKVTDDGFFLGIESKDKRFDLAETRRLLESSGAIAVEDATLDPDPETRRMPIWLYGFIIVSTVFALVPFALIYRARATHAKEPHWNIFTDMDFQAKAKSDTACELFPDGRCNRGELPGTVARGWLEDDTAFYKGLTQETGGEWITNLPTPRPSTDPYMNWPGPTPEEMARGQQRYNIYCSPCHGYDGRGDGMIPQRVRRAGAGALLPRNLVDPKTGVATIPNGQLFNTISNGYNTMMGYQAQIPAADRWAIVLYVRALERGANAGQADVPQDKMSEMNGATP